MRARREMDQFGPIQSTVSIQKHKQMVSMGIQNREYTQKKKQKTKSALI